MMSGQDVQLPPGFRFHPTDEELVMHYLCRKCSGMSISVPIIADIDLYKYDPWDLPGMAVYGEKEWYFFSPRERKYPNGCRPNRAAASGYWKATGADKAIGGGANSNSNSNSKAVGIKKALVFYAGKAPKGDKTNWIMHEYRLAHVDRSLRNKRNTSTSSSRLDDWVLCRIYNKKGSLDKHLNSHHPKRIMGGLKDTRPEPMTPEQKPLLPSHLPLPLPHQMMLDHPLDSMPRLHTDSSCCSEHVLSPDFTCDREREVQSQPRWEWDEWDKPHTLPFHNANMSMATRGFTDFGSGLIEPGDPIQDILMFLQKPF